MKSLQELELPNILMEFLSYMDVVKGKSSTTVFEYAMDLRTFLRYCMRLKKLVPSKTPIASISIVDVDLEFIRGISIYDAFQFLKYCKDERKNSAKTRARKMSSIRSFFNYLTAKTKQLEENPMTELETPKIKKSLPRFLSLEQSRDLLNCVDGPYKERDYCILVLFLNCGMRLSELVTLNVHDILEDSLRILGKGNKERMVYINSVCREALSGYMKVRPRDGIKDKNALFISKQKQRISPKTVQHLVKTYLHKIGLEEGYSTHKLRHTAATLMYRYGDADILVLKEILGHENVGTTEIYTHVSQERLQKTLDSNPLSQFKASDSKTGGQKTKK